MTRLRTGTWAVLGAAVLWGTTGTAATFAPRGSGSLAVGAAAMGIGGLALLATARRSAVALIRAHVTSPRLWLGAGAIVVYPLAFYSSMSQAGVAIGVTLSIGAAPIAAALMERLLHARRLSRRWALTVAIAVIGAALLGAGRPAAPDHHAAHLVTGVLLALVAAGCYAGYSVAAAAIIEDGETPRATVGALFGLAAAVLVPVLLLTGGTLLSSGRGLLVAGYLGLIPMTIGYILFGQGLRHVTASQATALSLLEPALAAVLADLVAGQHLTGIGWLGIGLVLASVLVQSRPARRAGRINAGPHHRPSGERIPAGNARGFAP
jgi:drug/metabolite transporter, DME family